MQRPVTVFIDTRKPVAGTIHREGVYEQLGTPRHLEAARTIAEAIDAEGERYPGFEMVEMVSSGKSLISFARYARKKEL
jgi:hypothetical protein